MWIIWILGLLLNIFSLIFNAYNLSKGYGSATLAYVFITSNVICILYLAIYLVDILKVRTKKIRDGL